MHSGQQLFSYMTCGILVSVILLSVVLLKVVEQLGWHLYPSLSFSGKTRNLPNRARVEHFVFLAEIELGLTRILVSKRISLYTPVYKLRYITLAVDS